MMNITRLVLQSSSQHFEILFKLNQLWADRKFQQLSEIPEDYRKLAESISSQSWLPLYAGLLGGGLSFGSALIPEANAGWKTLTSTLGQQGVSSIKECITLSYESEHTLMRGTIQVGESRRDTWGQADNAGRQALSEYQQMLSSFIHAEQALAQS